MRNITTLSPPAPVSMTDVWHEIASLDHFWIERRLEVYRTLARNAGQPRGPAGEIGCGRGLLQRQIEEEFQIPVDGIELDFTSLSSNMSARGQLYCYNIHDRLEEMRSKYQTIFLFDVLEHIADEAGFLESVLFHLRPGGRLLVNLPASMALFSAYDRHAGHLRRYAAKDLHRLTGQAGLKTIAWTYWGLPFYPLLLVRKAFMSRGSEEEVIKRGFQVSSAATNALLKAYARLEKIPQQLFGTSLMAILERPQGA